MTFVTCLYYEFAQYAVGVFCVYVWHGLSVQDGDNESITPQD